MAKVHVKRRHRKPQFPHRKIWLRRIRRDGFSCAYEAAMEIGRTRDFWAAVNHLGGPKRIEARQARRAA